MITKQAMGAVLKHLAHQQERSRETIAVQTGLSVYTVNRVMQGAPRTGWVAYLTVGVSLGYLPAEYKRLLREKYQNTHKKLMIQRFQSLLQRYRESRNTDAYAFRPVWVDIAIYIGVILTLACVVGIVIVSLRA